MFRNYIKTLVILVAIIVVLIASYLLINRATDKRKIEAISRVRYAMGYSNYPDKPGKVKGTISGGGPAPGLQIPGEFETKVKLKFVGTYQVTFIEYWNSKDFKYQGSKDGTQSHFTTFQVKGDNAKYIEEGGDFPPESVK